MSLYNMLFGVNAKAAVWLSPFLPRCADSFPRFRDISIETDPNPTIKVYTRMGGGNRECWENCTAEQPCCACDATTLETDPSCVGRHDDDFDSTYCTFLFRVRDDMLADFRAIASGEPGTTTESYRERLRSMWASRPEILEFIEQSFAVSTEPRGVDVTV